MGLEQSILDLMNSPDPSNVNLAYHLITGQGLGLEKYLRAWINERFEHIKQMKQNGLCRFLKEDSGVLGVNFVNGFAWVMNKGKHDLFLKALSEDKTIYFMPSVPYFALCGFFEINTTIRFILHPEFSDMGKLITNPYQYSIPYIKIPDYLWT